MEHRHTHTADVYTDESSSIFLSLTVINLMLLNKPLNDNSNLLKNKKLKIHTFQIITHSRVAKQFIQCKEYKIVEFAALGGKVY